MLGGILAALRNHQIPQVMAGGKQEHGQKCGDHREKGWELPQPLPAAALGTVGSGRQPGRAIPGHIPGPMGTSDWSSCVLCQGLDWHLLLGLPKLPPCGTTRVESQLHLRVVYLKRLQLPDTPKVGPRHCSC